MLQNQIRAGGEFKQLCSRCNLELTHTILAVIGDTPARIRCNTCKSERNYKAPKLATILRTPWESRPPVSDEAIYQRKLKENATKSEKKYRIDVELSANDLVDHSVFGRGVVLKTIPPDRAEILFKDHARVLVCRCKSIFEL